MGKFYIAVQRKYKSYRRHNKTVQDDYYYMNNIICVIMGNL